MCILLLLEEAEEENFALHLLQCRKRRKINEIILKKTRNNKELFATVLSYIECDIARNPYNMRFPISPKEKLCATLRTRLDSMIRSLYYLETLNDQKYWNGKVAGKSGYKNEKYLYMLVKN
ncbi:hypothetical protein NQ317_012235 [Molorchus minor]|uniref:Uncharacterized protein n=1 Tax=Molorchus minor TaxID=1323400 RepID=A0ABQ9J1E6_9CUCU|nr:hypothetical protein NQ317_012235 [Molorchus minor]